MNLYPAIDVKDGFCVRLYQGDYRQETQYSMNPLAYLENLALQGACWVHLVDLNAAKNPDDAQFKLLSELIKNSSLKIQVGGGIRSKEQVEYYLAAGVSRVVIGSLALTHPEEVNTWFEYFSPERIVLAFDVRCQSNQINIMMNAWQTQSQYTLFERVAYYQKFGLKHLLCTDINQDGTLHGPNFDLYRDIQLKFPELQVQASGGISALADLKQLKKMNVAGAVIGKALYEKCFTLREALAC